MLSTTLAFAVIIFSALCSAAELYSDIIFDAASEEFPLALLSRFVDEQKLDIDGFAQSASKPDFKNKGFSTTGFVYFSLFTGSVTVADSNCSEASFIAGYGINSCVASSSYSIKFQLSEDGCSGGIVQYFDDRKCTRYLGSTSLDGADGQCIISKDPSYTFLNHTVSQTTVCTTNPIPPAPSAGLTTVYYEGEKCEGEVAIFSFFPASVCLPITSLYQFMLSCPATGVPMYSAYVSPTCAGTPIYAAPSPGTLTCSSSDTDDRTANDDYVPPVVQPPPSISTTPYPTLLKGDGRMRAFMSYCPGQQPVRKPTMKPTAFPTRSEAVIVTFSAVLTLLGVDKAAFEASEVAVLVFKEAVASTMSGGVTSDDITKLSVKNVAARRRLQSGASAVTASFTVSTQSVYTTDQLFTELSGAVSSGAFNTALFDKATAAGAAALTGATARSVSRTSEPTKPELSTGAIVGIAIGGAALLKLIIGYVYYVRVKNALSRSVYVEAKVVDKSEEVP